MPKQKIETEYERKSTQVNVSLSPILKEELQKLVDEGYFSNVSDAVRYAIHEMLAKFRAEGKLKERTKNAQLIEENEIEFE